MKSFILFDLDGTLTDPGPGITNCVTYALGKFNIQPSSREELYPYIGPPLTWSFQEYHGLTVQQAEQALLYYRERFSVKGLFENDVYAGIPEMLEQLRQAGATLMIATSKPEEFTRRILEHFDLAKYFSFVAGNTLNEERPTKASVIQYILDTHPEVTPSNAVMVGDRKFDVLGAAAFGIPAIGVLFGYGSREELTEAGAAMLAETPQQLEHLLLKMV